MKLHEEGCIFRYDKLVKAPLSFRPMRWYPDVCRTSSQRVFMPLGWGHSATYRSSHVMAVYQ